MYQIGDPCSLPHSSTVEFQTVERIIWLPVFRAARATPHQSGAALEWCSPRMLEEYPAHGGNDPWLTAVSMTWQETTELPGKLNRTLHGKTNYFEVGTVTQAYRALVPAITRRWREAMLPPWRYSRALGYADGAG